MIHIIIKTKSKGEDKRPVPLVLRSAAAATHSCPVSLTLSSGQLFEPDVPSVYVAVCNPQPRSKDLTRGGDEVSRV